MPLTSEYSTHNTTTKHNNVPNNFHLNRTHKIAKIKNINPAIYNLFQHVYSIIIFNKKSRKKFLINS